MLKMTHRAEVPRPMGKTLPPEAETPPSLLGPDVVIEGVLEIEGELVIYGLVRGRIAAIQLIPERCSQIESCAGENINHS